MHQSSLREAVLTARATSEVPQTLEVAELARRTAGDATAPSLAPGYLLLGATIVSVCAMVFAMAYGSHDCQIKPTQFVFGITDLSVTTPAGTPCTIVVRPGSGAVDALTIESQPKHGTVTARGRTGVIYRPDRKFRGEDEFVFSIHAGPSSLEKASVIRVLATTR
jgi:hypothetical protein